MLIIGILLSHCELFNTMFPFLKFPIFLLLSFLISPGSTQVPVFSHYFPYPQVKNVCVCVLCVCVSLCSTFIMYYLHNIQSGSNYLVRHHNTTIVVSYPWGVIPSPNIMVCTNAEDERSNFTDSLTGSLTHSHTHSLTHSFTQLIN